ncbi:MaoC/PaaZ C-terminal domain-containing protein [Kitasatospora cineracea]|uniref:Acyl dehydratase n=1 Tax=Kitasatospora cineracea TaxID=88074 RepID=A0A8G1UMA1_9ACTN|nr:MaoC/PaaZ C-terminal domain-containing protein [Kitasatospora cineracea]ROR46561.1 acyl dehydratase [Kitasatospora cineracea]
MSSFTEAVAQAEQRIGTQIGMSDWVPITQDKVTAFGGLTLDFDPHHIDPRQAADGPFGRAVAHGFMVLSLLTHFLYEAGGELGFTQNVNYGFDRVRFVAPVPVGSEVRGEFVLREVQPKNGGALITFDVTVRCAPETVALVAEWKVLVLP